jgi:pyruvate dehydrogenase E2 component (dihydrolipoamide acetyltransferase)
MTERQSPGDQNGDENRLPLSRMRRAIAASMTLSAQIPQFTLDRTVILSDADAFRTELRDAGLRVSWEDFLVAASARALREHLNVNSSFDEDAVVEHPDIHIGLATAVKDGLMSPAILNADRQSLEQLVQERSRLRQGAASGTLRGIELFGATFTISNLGPYGVDRFRALVIPPQAAILASGRVIDDGGPRIALTLSCDHRVLDGAPAAEFLATVCDLLENPDWLRNLVPVATTR